MTNIKCEICGSLDIFFNFPEDERILKCKNCNTVFLNPHLGIREPIDYYYRRYSLKKYRSAKRIEMLKNNSQEVLRIMRKNIPAGFKTLLDVGANIGVFVYEANKNGYKALGIEPSKEMVLAAKEMRAPVIDTNIEEFVSKEHFEVVTMFHVLEHIPKPIEAIENIKRLQKRGDFLVIEVPNIESYMARKDKISWKFFALEHLFYFSPKTISKFLEGLGYKMVIIKRRNFELNYLNIRKLLRYFWGGSTKRDRFFKKDESKNYFIKLEEYSLFKKLVKKILLLGIRFLGREDHILIISKKT